MSVSLTAQQAQRLVATPLERPPDLLALSAERRLRRPAVISVCGWQVLLADPVERLRSLDALAAFAERVGWREDPPPHGPPVGITAVGYLSDALDPELLDLPRDDRAAPAPLGAVDFGVHDWAVAVAPDGRGWVVAQPDRVDALASWALRTPSRVAGPPVEASAADLALPREEHRQAVQRILGWIAAGDLYQANLTLQVRAPWPHPPHELARRLWAATPAAHAALLVLDDVAVVSASPETFLRTRGHEVTTRPIKGTRARGADPQDDAVQREALRNSAKDHAEHVMIVDLERNDLGRVCRAGSVRVAEYAAVERHPTVWHLTSTVQGRLRDDVGLGDLLRATFPPGSVTGTPKRMAVARTRLVERQRRGVYCGAIGVLTRGLLDLSVAIRTAVVHDGVASYGAGGGIVADSDPDAEFCEAMDKAAAFLAATNATIRE